MGLPSMVPQILGGSLQTPPGPLNSKKSLDRIGLMAIMAHTKFHLNRSMITFSFGMPGERLKRPGLIQ